MLSFTGFRFVEADGTYRYEGYTPPEGHLSLTKLMERNVIHTSTVVVRREVLLAIGGFDESLNTCEDFDLWLKIAATSPTAIRAIPERLADYRRHEGQVTKSWEGMHAGWCAVADRLAREHPKDWARVDRRAWGYQLEYCASLAYNAGDTKGARRLMLKAWRKSGLGLLADKNAVTMTGVAVVSAFPRPIQIAIGSVAQAARRWSSKP